MAPRANSVLGIVCLFLLGISSWAFELDALAHQESDAATDLTTLPTLTTEPSAAAILQTEEPWTSSDMVWPYPGCTAFIFVKTGDTVEDLAEQCRITPTLFARTNHGLIFNNTLPAAGQRVCCQPSPRPSDIIEGPFLGCKSWWRVREQDSCRWIAEDLCNTTIRKFRRLNAGALADPDDSMTSYCGRARPGQLLCCSLEVPPSSDECTRNVVGYMEANDVLKRGECLRSLQGRAVLKFEANGTLRLYRNREGLLAPTPCHWSEDGAASLVLTERGSIALLDSEQNILLEVTLEKQGHRDGSLVLDEDGDIILYNHKDQPVWRPYSARYFVNPVLTPIQREASNSNLMHC